MKKMIAFVFSINLLFAYNINTFNDDVARDIVKIQDILASDKDDRSAELFRLLNADLDIDLMTRLVLSKHISELTPDKLAEFKTLFIERLKKDFSTKIDLVKGSSLKLVDTNYDDKKCQANMKAVYEEQEKTMNFKFRRIKDECRLYDIEILNTSLIASYRAQFLDIIRQSGINALFEKLK